MDNARTLARDSITIAASSCPLMLQQMEKFAADHNFSMHRLQMSMKVSAGLVTSLRRGIPCNRAQAQKVARYMGIPLATLVGYDPYAEVAGNSAVPANAPHSPYEDTLELILKEIQLLRQTILDLWS